MEEVRARLPPGAEIDWFKARIKDIQTEMAETMPEMPDSWLSKRIQQLSKQAEKVKKEAEKEDVKAVWKKCQKVSLCKCRPRE